MTYQTEQEDFWAGEFGNSYVARNTEDIYLCPDIHLFSNIIRRMQNVRTLIEFGANIGLNLKALKTLLPNLSCDAIEINAIARDVLKQNADHVFAMSILEYTPQQQYDVVLCKGILIHINPEQLSEVYKKIYTSAKKFIIIAEYYNPTPVMVKYRGNVDRLFKRDFAGELLERYPDLKLVDYGFQYHRDPNFPMDDVNWFLLEKTL